MEEIKTTVANATAAVKEMREAFSKLSEERSVCERILEGKDGWTETDCTYLIEGVNKLEQALANGCREFEKLVELIVGGKY